MSAMNKSITLKDLKDSAIAVFEKYKIQYREPNNDPASMRIDDNFSMLIPIPHNSPAELVKARNLLLDFFIKENGALKSDNETIDFGTEKLAIQLEKKKGHKGGKANSSLNQEDLNEYLNLHFPQMENPKNTSVHAIALEYTVSCEKRGLATPGNANLRKRIKEYFELRSFIKERGRLGLGIKLP